MNRPWTDFISAEDESRYARAGFGHSSGIGSNPALLIIDVQFRTLGDTPKPFDQALEDYTTAVGEAGWAAVDHIVTLLDTFRSREWPVLYPHVAPKQAHDSGTLGAKVPSIMDVPSQGYAMPEALLPRPGRYCSPRSIRVHSSEHRW